MANSYTSRLKEGAQYVQTAKNGDENDSQVVRKTDLDKDLTKTSGTAYDDSNLLNSIYVIYKISVNNASPTPGYATQIVDYYDKKYHNIRGTLVHRGSFNIQSSILRIAWNRCSEDWKAGSS